MPEQPQTLSTQQALDLALQHHRAGRLPQAESIYKQILQGDPNQPVVLQLLGVSAHQLGNNDVAVDLITKALALEPEYPEAHNNLGLALQGLGKPDDAVNSYRKALAIRPDYADAHNNLGNALRRLDKLEERPWLVIAGRLLSIWTTPGRTATLEKRYETKLIKKDRTTNQNTFMQAEIKACSTSQRKRSFGTMS